MEKYLTNFYNEASYNSFLVSDECPVVNVSYITETDEVKYYDSVNAALKEPLEAILVSDAYRTEYTRWEDEQNRWLAEGSMRWGQYKIGEYWYLAGNKLKLYIGTVSDGLVEINGTEWTYDNENGWKGSGDYYYSSTLVNGYPVAARYNGDSANPDFYIYDSDEGNISYVYFNFTDPNRSINDPLPNWSIWFIASSTTEQQMTGKYRTVDKTGLTPVYGDWTDFNYSVGDGHFSVDLNIPMEINKGIQLICKSNGIRVIPESNETNDTRADVLIDYSGNYMSVVWGELFPYSNLKNPPYPYHWDGNFNSVIGNRFFRTANDCSKMIIPINGVGGEYFEGKFRNSYRRYKAPIFLANYVPYKVFNAAYGSDYGNQLCSATTLPKLNFKTVSRSNTLNSMFKNNRNITNIDPATGNSPETDWLDIKNISLDYNEDGCFNYVFYNCICLKYAPPMHLEKVDNPRWVFYEAFRGCKSLVECDWEIPIYNDTETDSQFGNMFYNCENLTMGPTIIGECTEYKGFDNMFTGCTSLTEVKFPGMIGPFGFPGVEFAASGTVYVNDNSVYLDQTSEYYGQTPITGWNVEAWSNYPSN